MKNKNLFRTRWLQVAFCTLIFIFASIGGVSAWTGIQLVSDFYGSYSKNAQDFTYGGEANKYWDVYHDGGTHYWRLYLSYFNHDAGPNTSNYVLNVGTTGYKVVSTSTNSFKTTGDAGIIRIQTSQNHDGASDEQPNVWVTRPTVKFKYPWDGTNWELVDATDNHDGTYTYRGTYRGTDYFNAGPNDGDKVAKESTTVNGSPSSGQRCEFKWQPGSGSSGTNYKYTGGEEDNRGIFTITKLLTVTYDANGATKGTVPDPQEILYNTSSRLATNSGNLERVGYKFKGWYTTSTGSDGTHYDAGGSITRTSNITLYAQWEAADVWCLKGAKTDGTGTDYLGGWSAAQASLPTFSYSSEHALVLKLYLGASQTYSFGIYKGDNSGKELAFYKNGGTIEETTTAEWQPDNNWEFTTGASNCTLKTSSEGTYVFTIDATSSNPRLRVYFPGDAPKVFLSKNKYIYLKGNTADAIWKADSYDARFWFKSTTENVHTSNIECLFDNALDVDYMYYARVPDNDYVDRVQINRINPTTHNPWNYSQVKHGYTRSNENQNCVVLPTSGNWGDGSSNWASLSWDTYCPPMSSAKIELDGSTTTIYGGDGGSNTPYLVAISSSINVSATSVSKVDDDNMTPYYQFKKADSNDGGESSTSTHTYTASGSSGTKEALTVVARNYYNGTYGTASPASDAIYYEARTPYSVTPSLTGVTQIGGRTGASAVVQNITYDAVFESNPGYDLPETVTVTIGGIVKEEDTDYTWNQSTGALHINENKITGNVAITVTGEGHPHILTLNDEFGATPFHVAANGGDATIDVTFGSNTNLTSSIEKPKREGYIFGGYYTAVDGGGEQIIDENGDVVANAGSGTYTDASRNWKLDADLPVYAKWTDDNIYVFYGMGRNGEGEFYNFGFWRYDDHWTKGKAPSDIDNHEVILIKQPEVDAPSTPSGQTYTACAKNIKIVTNGSYTCVDGTIIPASEYPKLSIDDNGAVVVKEYVRTYDMEEDKFGPTTSLNLHINAGTGRWGTAGSGGVLIMGDKIADNKAWVEFYTKAHKASHTDDETGETVNDYVNQYFGIPFDSTSVYDYEGVYLYAYKAETNSYEAAGNKPVNPFMAYLMLRTETERTTLHMTGRLALPGADPKDPERLKVLDLYSKADATASNMFANSWNGPIDIKAMDVEGVNTDFVGVEPTFYLYNAGSKYDQELAGSKMGDGAGQWSSFPVEAVKANPSSYPQSVIPPQQAFLLVAQSDESSATHTLTLDYYKHVYKPAYDLVKAGEKIEIAPTRAPRHATMEYPLEIIQLHVQGADREYSDRMILYQRNDFSDGIDQGWEGRKIMGSSFAPQMFAISDDGKMSINAVKDVEGTVIGFRKGSEDAQYTISFEYRGEDVWYLNDLKEEKSTLISDEDTYMFTSNDSDIETRFVISATPIHKTPTSVDNLNDGVKARKQMIDGTLYIIRDGRIYSTTGAMVK